MTLTGVPAGVHRGGNGGARSVNDLTASPVCPHTKMRQAGRSAITLVHEAINAKVPSQDIGREAMRAATRAGITGWQLEAVDSLVIPAKAIILMGEDDYTNGQHRGWVMREQRVPIR